MREHIQEHGWLYADPLSQKCQAQHQPGLPAAHHMYPLLWAELLSKPSMGREEGAMLTLRERPVGLLSTGYMKPAGQTQACSCWWLG
jgi:hypothetical protein